MISPTKKYILSIFFSLTSSVIFAQVVQGVEAKIVEDDLVVTYKVAGINTTQLFDVELLSSHDKFATPLSGPNLTGKIGSRIPLDASNDIVIKNPLDVVLGVTNVSFRVRIKMVYFPVTITSHQIPFKQKSKKDIEIAWRGGLRGEQVKFDLYKDDQLVKDDMYTISNNGIAEFKFPKVKKGENYMIKLEMASLSDPVEFPTMRVRPKKSIAGRIFRLGILFGGGYLIYNEVMGGDEPIPGGGGTSSLPDAPEPPSKFNN